MLHLKWEVTDVSLNAQLYPEKSAFWPEKCPDWIQ